VSPDDRLVVRLAPAKLNLTLAVIGRRRDGFHDLHSVFAPLALADRLSLTPIGPPGSRPDTLHVDGPDTGPIASNLVLRGIAAARQAVGAGPGRPATPPLAGRLEKRIPVAAGLAGGSSDGAAAFLGALEAWGAELDPDRRAAAAAAIGSDVPFFLTGGIARVEGRGERVTSLTGVRGEVGVLLVTPAVPVRTPDVFAVFDGIRERGDGSIRMTSQHLAEELAEGMTSGTFVSRAGILAVANDLLPAAVLVEPRLVTVRRAMMRALGRPVGVSGSGPTLWSLYDSRGEAELAADRVRSAIADGSVPVIGDAPPSIIATTVLTGREEPST